MGILLDVIQFLVIAYLIAVSIITTRKLDRVEDTPTVIHQPLPPVPEEKAICGCEHHKCYHDDSGCGHNSNIYEINSVHPIAEKRCGCKGYMGPEHLPQVIP